MMRMKIHLLIIIVLLSSCGPRSGTSNNQVMVESTNTTPDPNQVQYVKNVIDIGSRIYKMNCAVCHCGPGSHCDPPSLIELRYIFDNLPLDSLQHYAAFIKNSAVTKNGLRKFPLVKGADKYNYDHEFETTLSDSLIKTVTEYLWVQYRSTN